MADTHRKKNMNLPGEPSENTVKCVCTENIEA